MNQKDVRWMQDTLQKMKSDLSWMSHEIWRIENILGEQTSARVPTLHAPDPSTQEVIFSDIRSLLHKLPLSTTQVADVLHFLRERLVR